jgi:Txe/YoeB family toxin of Txe-Axe toxin-antitoxin module
LTNTFKTLYKKKQKKSPRHLVERIDEAILELRKSENPERLGGFKQGRLDGLIGYDLNASNRILYMVDRREEGAVVTLLRVCTHKQAYRTD